MACFHIEKYVRLTARQISLHTEILVNSFM